MRFLVQRSCPNQLIRIPVETRGAQRISIVVSHSSKPNTDYFRTSPVIKGRDAFIVKIPKIPKRVTVEIWNDARGHMNNDPSFRIGKVRLSPIVMPYGISKIDDPKVNSFAAFSDYFAENAGILSARNSIYASPDGRFSIDYKDVIRDAEGEELTTPSRINSRTGVMEIAKKYYMGYTVPGRKAVQWHEYAHIHMNKNPSDEMAADKHSIAMYLCMGNPTIEAFNVWCRIFKNRASDNNVARWDEIRNYIANFHNEMSKRANTIAA
ncbi:MAG: hypothetical protein COA79_20305 [Planctomycetota bacterium]|nr:MAG: hypothetical protein COA79_20305 [Planctomycetota bacterium]